MASTKSNDFLGNNQLPLIFPSEFSFIVNNFSLEIDDYAECFLTPQKSLLKT